MEINKVPASHGWQWFINSLTMIKQHPTTFLVMGLILSLFAIIPVVGPLIFFIFGPALVAGICYAAHQADINEVPEIGQILQSFKSGHTGSMVALCLPGILIPVVFSILLGILLVIFSSVSHLPSMDILASDPDAMMTQMGAAALLIIPMVLVVTFLVYALTFFAIPRTLLGRPQAIANMVDSLKACWKNLGAVIITLLTLFVCMVVIGLILGILSFLLGPLVVVIGNTLLFAISGPLLYFAYKDVFGSEKAAIDDALNAFIDTITQ